MAANDNAKAWEADYYGERAVWLKAGRYEAALLPDTGGNLIALRDTEHGLRFLHEPGAEELEAFKNRPVIHGIPVLFPPNRFEDGTFTLGGKTYKFPVNETQRNNHLHGFLYDIPWNVTGFGAAEESSFVEIEQNVDEAHPVYSHFPHRFRFRIRYTLSEQGLHQAVEVTNEGGEPMPCMVAFHTSVNAPFAPDGSADDYKLKLSIGNRWEMNDRMLPTGNFQPLTRDEELMASTGVYPFFGSMDNHYTAVPVNGVHLMTLTDTKLGIRLVYEADPAYKQWMIWNNNATPGFFCPEPQSMLVNAPNSGLPPEQTGIVMLAPGAAWRAECRLYSETVGK
ncbi:aldose epimerase [Gordoniibacillus kamchatkensis]|uniref:Aldose epimerase n=1 Tax=Gordoniibacillus kamchatkensis TaxID=1590651 RepID=A0ABR5AGC6_9BACL|nr:aldose 1-epimerase [Paenibacillus sp. VKM B-2647]KIL40010.1 aldose epimerase [Paenibacillus sp. VKM B-2647]